MFTFRERGHKGSLYELSLSSAGTQSGGNSSAATTKLASVVSSDTVKLTREVASAVQIDKCRLKQAGRCVECAGSLPSNSTSVWKCPVCSFGVCEECIGAHTAGCPKPLSSPTEKEEKMFVTDQQQKKRKEIAWEDQTEVEQARDEKVCYICKERRSILECDCCNQPKAVCGACCLLRHVEGRWQPHDSSGDRNPPDRETEGVLSLTQSSPARRRYW